METLATGAGAPVAAREILGDSYYAIGRVTRPLAQQGQALSPRHRPGWPSDVNWPRKTPQSPDSAEPWRTALRALDSSRCDCRSVPSRRSHSKTANEARRNVSRIDPQGRSAAIASFEKALLIQRKLVEEHPGNTQFQSDLADSLYNAAVARNGPGKTDGLDLHRESLEIRAQTGRGKPSRHGVPEPPGDEPCRRR